jgi:hypothetical protein
MDSRSAIVALCNERVFVLFFSTQSDHLTERIRGMSVGSVQARVTVMTMKAAIP